MIEIHPTDQEQSEPNSGPYGSQSNNRYKGIGGFHLDSLVIRQLHKNRKHSNVYSTKNSPTTL